MQKRICTENGQPLAVLFSTSGISTSSPPYYYGTRGLHYALLLVTCVSVRPRPSHVTQNKESLEKFEFGVQVPAVTNRPCHLTPKRERSICNEPQSR